MSTEVVYGVLFGLIIAVGLGLIFSHSASQELKDEAGKLRAQTNEVLQHTEMILTALKDGGLADFQRNQETGRIQPHTVDFRRIAALGKAIAKGKLDVEDGPEQ